MSKPVFEDLFAFHGRRNRKSFALLSLAMFVFIFLAAAFNEIQAQIDPFQADIYGFLLGLALIFLGVVSTIASAQRFRDFGLSGWLALLGLIPYLEFVVLIILLLYPGDEGRNQYGPDPKRPSSGVRSSGGDHA